jgi:hypothetical protein
MLVAMTRKRVGQTPIQRPTVSSPYNSITGNKMITPTMSQNICIHPLFIAQKRLNPRGHYQLPSLILEGPTPPTTPNEITTTKLPSYLLYTQLLFVQQPLFPSQPHLYTRTTKHGQRYLIHSMDQSESLPTREMEETIRPLR